MAEQAEAKREEKQEEAAPAAAKTKEETKDSGPKLEGKMAEFVDWVETISVIELSHLVKALEDRLGVTASAPVAVAAAGAAPAGGGDGAAEEQTEFSVVLTETGGQKIQVIKEVRALTSLGLKEAKELVDSAPKAVKEGVSKEEAEEIKQKLEAVGAKAEIK